MRLFFVNFIFFTVAFTSNCAEANQQLIFGDKRRVFDWDAKNLGGTTHLTVSGAIKVSVEPGKMDECHLTRTRIDQNLKSKLKIDSKEKHLKIDLHKNIIPSDWVEIELSCSTISHVTTSNHAIVVLRTSGQKTLKLSANNALISVIGEANSFESDITNKSILGLIEFKANSGNLNVTHGAMADLVRNDDIKISTNPGGKVFVLDKSKPRGPKEEISKGIILVPYHQYVHEFTQAYHNKKDFKSFLKAWGNAVDEKQKSGASKE